MLKVIGAIDLYTRCKHYHGNLDIIAIKFKCCDIYYGCYYCHEESTNHPPQVWKQDDWSKQAILCGNCQTELTIDEYLNCNYSCPACNAQFNPKCENHYHFYFDMTKKTGE